MTTGSAIRHFALDLEDLRWTGQDLARPEAVAAERDGTLWACDARGGLPRIDPTARRPSWAAGAASPTGWRSTRPATWSARTSRWGWCSP